MTLSFKDKIAVVGVGCTKFAENFDLSYGDMLAEACFQAFEEARVEPKDIEAAWLSTAFVDASAMKGRSGMDLAEPVGLFDIPITRVSNFCASGGNAFREACLALLSGVHDIVLAVGAEKLRDRPPQKSLVKMMVEAQHPFLQKGETAAGQFAVYATRHMEKYGTKIEHFCMVSHKNHKNGVRNPIAQYRQEIPLETIIKSPMVAYPINVLCFLPNNRWSCSSRPCPGRGCQEFQQGLCPSQGAGIDCQHRMGPTLLRSSVRLYLFSLHPGCCKESLRNGRESKTH